MTSSRRSIYLVLVMSLTFNLVAIAREFRPFRTDIDVVTLKTDQLAPLISALPTYGKVGYMFDPLEIVDGSAPPYPNVTIPLPTNHAQVAFIIVQYAIAPHILVNSIDAETIIGNFYSDANIALAKKHLTIEKTGAGGLYLLKRK